MVLLLPALAVALVPMPPVIVVPPGAGCTVVGTTGADVLVGTAGTDVLCGLGGADVLRGLAGLDVLRGGDGTDRLVGGSGGDRVMGGRGVDSLSGGGGSDVLKGRTGDDVIAGGAGFDVVSYRGKAGPVVVSLGAVGGDGVAGEDDTVRGDVEGIRGTQFADRLTGNTAANLLRGRRRRGSADRRPRR